MAKYTKSKLIKLAGQAGGGTSKAELKEGLNKILPKNIKPETIQKWHKKLGAE